jgi:hypothetical protein
LRKTLNAMRNEVFLTTPSRTLAELDRAKQQAHLVMDSDGAGHPGDPVALAPELLEPLVWIFDDGVARYTRVYHTPTGAWISAFAPIVDANETTTAVLAVDYSVDLYLDRLHDVDTAILQASAGGTVAALIFGLLLRANSPADQCAHPWRRVSPQATSPKNSRYIHATKSASSRAPSTTCWEVCASATSSAMPSAATSPEVAKTLLESPRDFASEATSAKSRYSCPTFASTRVLPSMATRHWSWRS